MRSHLAHDDLVTGEAVVVMLPAAGPGIRLASGLIDAVVAIILLVLLNFAVARTAIGLDEALIASLHLLVSVGVLVAFPAACETWTGRTVGKVVTGLRTVRNDGGPADARRIITRHLLAVPEVWLTSGSVALIAWLLTDPTRRLGDMAAGTYVARDRIRLALPPRAPMPPALETWARSADLGRLPDDLVTLVRTTLAQDGQFTQGAAARVDGHLVDRVLRHVA
ncbi:MAG: RDD family protein, partial [Micrococcus sp.]|nr:RDD family protein [Micrococcus sp.]